MVIFDAVKQNKRAFAVLMIFLLLLYAVFSILIVYNATLLDSQTEWKRWKGENEMEFSQISCFVPDSEAFTVNDVGTFRSNMMDKLKEASLDISSQQIIDCWSCNGNVQVISEKAFGSAGVTAVGGSFFDFHPLKLLSGTTISENDFMKDRVVLDNDLAWYLFGGTDLQGLTIKVNGMTLVIAGVVEREQDFASRKAYSGTMGLYMSFETYEDLLSGNISPYAAEQETDSEAISTGKSVNISCYEICMPDPVKNFALNAVQDKFPVKTGVIRQNTGRFGFPRMLANVASVSRLAMQDGVPRPYWENAALFLESANAHLLIGVFLSTLIPASTFIAWIIRGAITGKERFEENYLPEIRESMEENIRAQQRKRWEKQYKKATGHTPKDSEYTPRH